MSRTLLCFCLNSFFDAECLNLSQINLRMELKEIVYVEKSCHCRRISICGWLYLSDG